MLPLKKEHIKSFILIILIINAIQLTIQIWFDSSLWPDGYGFIDDFRNSSFVTTITSIFSGDSESMSGEQLYAQAIKPRRIIINGGGAREVYNIETDDYNKADQFVNKVIKSFKKSKITVSPISYNEWKDLFKVKSLYIDFGYGVDADNLNIIYDVKSSEGKFEQFKNASGYIIVPDLVTNNCSICMLDQSTNKVYRHSFNYDGSELLTYIEDSTYAKQQNDTFAFEINLDSSSNSDQDVEQMVSLSPLSLLSISETKFNSVTFNKIFENDEDFEKFTEKSLAVFGYNASNLRKSIQSDNTIVYIENNATIKFYPDGTVEYNAVNKDGGIKISPVSTSCSNAVNEVLNIVKNIWDKSGVSHEFLTLHLDSLLADNSDNTYTIKLNNTFNGIVINYDKITNNCVYANIENGYITKFVMHISGVTKTDSVSEPIPVLQGIDIMYEKQNNKKIVIDDVYRCYHMGKNGQANVKWAFKVNDDDNILVIDNIVEEKD